MGVFPIRSIPTDDLAQELAKRASIPIGDARSFLWKNLDNGGAGMRGDTDRYNYTTPEAARFLIFAIKGGQFSPGTAPTGASLEQFKKLAPIAGKIFYQRFFDNMDLHEANAQQLGLDRPYVVTSVLSVHDGDTWKVQFIPPGGDQAIVGAMRFVGYDTPEVGGPKLLGQLKEKVPLFMSQNGGPLQSNSEAKTFSDALSLHLQYEGNLSRILWQDLVPWIINHGGRFEVASSYASGNDAGAACGMLELVDTYGRWLGLPQVSDPSLLDRYMQERLPQLMADQGMTLYSQAQSQANAIPGLNALLVELRKRGDKGKQAADLIDPALRIHPDVAYSPAATREQLKSWQQLTGSLRNQQATSGYARDMSAFTIHLGLAYHYNKYRTQRSPFYDVIESASRQRGVGLWQESLFQYMKYTKDPGQCVVPH